MLVVKFDRTFLGKNRLCQKYYLCYLLLSNNIRFGKKKFNKSHCLSNLFLGKIGFDRKYYSSYLFSVKIFFGKKNLRMKFKL